MTRRCSSCGQLVESERDKLERNAVIATAVALSALGVTLSVAEWTLSWWAERPHVIVTDVVTLSLAIYFWIRRSRVREV